MSSDPVVLKRQQRRREEVCQIKTIKKKRLTREQGIIWKWKSKEREWRKRWGKFLWGSGLAWTSWNTDTVTGRGGSKERVNERRRMRRTKRRSIRPQWKTGSSTPVSTTWPLPELGIPKPVITQNTQGLTGSLSQHCFPLGHSGLRGMCDSAGLFCPVNMNPEKYLCSVRHLKV